MRRVAPYIFTLLLGVLIGGFLFSKSVQRSVLAVQGCDNECLQLKELAGLLGNLWTTSPNREPPAAIGPG